MPVTVGTVREAQYFPEVFPVGRIGDIPPESSMSPEPLDLRSFGADRIVQLRDVAAQENASVQAVFQADSQYEVMRLSAMPNDLQVVPVRYNATERLAYSLQNSTGVAVQNFTTRFSVLVDRPTTVDKLRYGLELNAEDEELLGFFPDLPRQVSLGQRPLSFEQRIREQYPSITEFFRTVRISQVGTTGMGTVFHTANALPGEALVLTHIAGDLPNPTDGLKIMIDRDGQHELVSLDAYGLHSLVRGIACWIPALQEIRFRAIASVPVSDYNVRLQFRRVQITPILQARWGLITEQDDPDTYRAVRAGLL